LVAKYIGKPVEIIYEDKNGRFSKRGVLLFCRKNGLVKGYCYKAAQMRTFDENRIYAVAPIRQVV